MQGIQTRTEGKTKMALMKVDEFLRLGRTIVFYESAIADFPNSQRTERKPRSKKQLEARLADLKKQQTQAKPEPSIAARA
jgi:hypothetical protein